ERSRKGTDPGNGWSDKSGRVRRRAIHGRMSIRWRREWCKARAEEIEMLQVVSPRVALDYRIAFGDQRFPYYVRRDGWTELLSHLRDLEADRYVIVVDGAFPAELAEAACRRVSSVAPCTTLICPSGEPAKTLTTLEALAADALGAGVTRRSCVI